MSDERPEGDAQVGPEPPDRQQDGDLYDDGWSQEDEERYQARRQREARRTRRRRRQALSFAVVVLLVLGVGIGAAGVVNGSWEWPFGDDAATTAGAGQPCPSPSVTAAPVEEVTVAVLNATETRGLAATVAAELQARGITVSEIGNDEMPVAEPALVRHGPESALAARTVAAQIPGTVLLDDARPGTAVELSIGAAFTALNPPEVAAAAIAPVAAPSPSGCVTPAPVDPAAPSGDPAATPTG